MTIATTEPSTEAITAAAEKLRRGEHRPHLFAAAQRVTAE
jgi:hypothetical protein